MVLHYLLLLFKCFANTVGPFRPAQDFDHAKPSQPSAELVGTSQVVAFLFAFCFCFVWMIVPWAFLTLAACSLI